MKFYSITRVSNFNDKHQTGPKMLFEKLENARKAIEDDSQNGHWGFCEALYNYLVIEEATFCDNSTPIDDFDFQEWYHMPTDNYEWIRVDRPGFAIGVCAFNDIH